jgi:hypothetical protein
LVALADGQVDRSSGARRQGIVTILPPLRTMVRVRCPHSRGPSPNFKSQRHYARSTTA